MRACLAGAREKLAAVPLFCARSVGQGMGKKHHPHHTHEQGGQRAMNTGQCLKIAERLHTLLVAELGVGLDAERMVEDPLYARDVLLVADAHRGHDLATLAAHFRAGAAEKPSLAQALGVAPQAVAPGLALGARQSTLHQGPKKRDGKALAVSPARLLGSSLLGSIFGASSGNDSARPDRAERSSGLGAAAPRAGAAPGARQRPEA
jgi:hypothetical protein